MSHREGVFHVVILSLVFISLSLLWEVSMVKWVVWSWKQLIATRHLYGQTEAFVTFTGVTLSTLVIVPHALWLPVTLFKEFLHVFKERHYVLSRAIGYA